MPKVQPSPPKPAPFPQLERQGFIGVIMGDDEALRPWHEKRREVEPEELSGNLVVRLRGVTEGRTARAERVVAAGRAQITGAPPKPSTTHADRSVKAVYAAFLTELAGHPPRLIPMEADSIDLQNRADHLNAVFRALAGYLAIILDDTVQNTPGRLDLSDAEAILADLASDLAGAIQLAADALAGDGL